MPDNDVDPPRRRLIPRFEPIITTGNVVTVVLGFIPLMIFLGTLAGKVDTKINTVDAALAVERAIRQQQIAQVNTEITMRGVQEQRDVHDLQESMQQNNAVSAAELADIKAILTNVQNRIDQRWENSPFRQPH